MGAEGVEEGGGKHGIARVGLHLGQRVGDAARVAALHERLEGVGLLLGCVPGDGGAGEPEAGAAAAVGGDHAVDALLEVARPVGGPGSDVPDLGRRLAGLDPGLGQQGLDVGGVGVQVGGRLVEVGLQLAAPVDVHADEAHGRTPWVSSVRPSATK